MLSKKQSKKLTVITLIIMLMMSNILPFISTVHEVSASEVQGIATSKNATTFAKDGDSVPVDSDLTINLTTATELDKATVVINNLKLGDTLAFSDQNGITGTYNSASGILTLSGLSSIENYQTALRSVGFQSTSTNLETRTITFTIGNALYFEPTQHFYEYVSTDSAISWEEAKIEAEGLQLYGRQGYLATITSDFENQFILDKALGLGWVGGRNINRNVSDGSFIFDDSEPADWRWVTGPEGLADDGKGLKFYSGYSGDMDNTVDYQEHDEKYKMENMDGKRYTNWLAGEPNNGGDGEWVVHIFGPSGTWWDNKGQGQWNDFANEVNEVKGYIVEYGGLPSDEVNNIEITASKDVNVSEEKPVTLAPKETDIIANATDNVVVVSNVPNMTTVKLYKDATLLESKAEVSGTITFTDVSLESDDVIQITYTENDKEESPKTDKLAQVRSTALAVVDISSDISTNTVIVQNVSENALIKVYNSSTDEVIGEQFNESGVGAVTVTTTSLADLDSFDVTITKAGELESIKTNKAIEPDSLYSKARAVFGGEYGTELFLGGKYIELGISNWGDFGTLGVKPDNFRGTRHGEIAPERGSDRIGMSADHDGYDYGRDLPVDYYLPGTPEERFAVGYKIGSIINTRSNSAQMNVKQIPTTVHNESSTEGKFLKARTVSVWNDTMEITQVISFNAEDKFYRNDVTMKNISTTSWDSSRYMRSFDPDNSQYRGGDFVTDNTVTHTIADDGIAVVKAETFGDSDPLFEAFGSRIPIFFYSNDSAARASVFGFSNSNPYAANAYDSPRAKGDTLRADSAITLTWDSGPLGAGESKTFTYYTSLDEREFDDVQKEIFVDDVKTDINNLKDMDDVIKVKTKIDNEDLVNEDKKRELVSELTDVVYDEEKGSDILIRDETDIIIMGEIITDSNKSVDEKDDLRLKLVKRIAFDIEELTLEEEEATRKIINEIVTSSKKGEASEIFKEKTGNDVSLENAIQAGEDALNAAEAAKARYTKTGGKETDADYAALETARAALEDALAEEPQVTGEIEAATQALLEAIDALENSSESKELENVVEAAAKAKETAEAAKVRYTTAGGEKTDPNYTTVEAAKVALEEALVKEPQVTAQIEAATQELVEAVNALEESSESKELENAVKAAADAKEKTEAVKARYTTAGGEESDERYATVEEAKVALEQALAEEPQVTAKIEVATQGLVEAVNALEESSESKELENAVKAAAGAKETAEAAKVRYTTAGGEKTDPNYTTVEEAKVALEEALLKEPQETEEIEAATQGLVEAISTLEESSESKELENAVEAAADAKETAEAAKVRYTTAGGEETDADYAAIEAAKTTLEEALLEEPRVTAQIEAATQGLVEAVKALEESSESKELENAIQVGEEALNVAEAAQARYTTANGEETDAGYGAVEVAKATLEEALAEEPQVTAQIEAATQALLEAISSLENSSESKELENAVEAAAVAKETAEAAKVRYTTAGGEETDAGYEAVEVAKATLEEALVEEPQETAMIEIALEELAKAVLALDDLSTEIEFEKGISQMISMDEAIQIKESIEDVALSDSVKAKLYSKIINQLIDSKEDFSFSNANQVLQIIDTIDKSDKTEADKQQAYIVLTEKAIDDVSRADEPTIESKFQQPENQAIDVGIEKVVDAQEKHKLTTLLNLTIDIRSLTMQTAFTFSENDTWESITLPFIMLAGGNYGSEISWESSKETVIEISGTDALVERKARDESVILTARASNGVETIEKTFLLVVKSNLLGNKLTEALKREVTVETGAKLTKPPVIQRINLLNSSNNVVVNKIDKLIIDDAIILEVTNEPVVIYLPDDKDNLADELAVEVSLSVLDKLQDTLTIKTDQGSIVLKKETLEKMKQDGNDLFFRIVPVRELDERNEVIERTRSHELVVAELQADQNVNVLGTPREIETNYKGYETTVILPLEDVDYTIIENLRIFIEHTDGDRKVLSGEQVLDEDNNPIGLQFTIDKFSTFTIFEIMNAESETPSEEEDETAGEETPPEEEDETAGEETPPEEDDETAGEETPPEEDDETAGEENLPEEEDETPGEEALSEDETLTDESTPGVDKENSISEEISEQEQNKENPDSETLPNTATSIYDVILLGFILTTLGALIIVSLSKRKKKVTA